MNRSLLFAIGLIALGLGISPVKASAQALEIYLIDVEGGGATLFVSPTGQTLLVDTGNGGQRAARDAGRIISAMRDAGVNEIDHLITTHWHGDHYGAMQELARQVSIQHFIDHGPSVETNAAVAEFVTPEKRGRLYGFYYTVIDGGAVIAPLTFGLVADLYSLNDAIFVMSLTTIAILPASMTLRKYIK